MPLNPILLGVLKISSARHLGSFSIEFTIKTILQKENLRILYNKPHKEYLEILHAAFYNAYTLLIDKVHT